MLCGLGQLGKQRRKKLVARREERHLVVLERQGGSLIVEKTYKLAAPVWHDEVALLYKLQHRPLGELVHAVLADELLLARVLPEEEVEHDAHHRQERQHQQPRQRLGGLTVVHEHLYHGHGNHKDVDKQY